MDHSTSFNPAAPADEIVRIQSELDHLKRSLLAPSQAHNPACTSRASRVRAILNARRKRELTFGKELFADPAWDMLLELYSAELAMRQISTTELCIGSAVPPTTALRWIEKLERCAWIARRNDDFDGRRLWFALSPRGAKIMHRYFDELEASTALL